MYYEIESEHSPNRSMFNVIIFLQDREADRGSALITYAPSVKW